MNLDDINQKAWELAAGSIMYKNRKFETYSNKQIRGFFELAKSKNFDKDIDSHIRKYNPQPSQGQNLHKIAGELNKMKELNESTGNKFKEISRGLSAGDRMKLSQYLMWNIKIIENEIGDIDKLKLILDCENVKEPEHIIEYLTRLSKDIGNERHSRQKHDNKERRR
ncbi:MAG: hypothetical protein IBX39_06670 [Candidatus Methanoperedenaceae archaeon]|nr:hypothetical protein [Candidatus Methanoperedenaceae archaeon]